MNRLAPLVLPAAFGLIAGLTHGLISHMVDLPVPLSEQISMPLEPTQTLRD